uniref:ABC transporter permease n=1 Tax=Pricia sp. TaxID=2268138 RepID=UPI003593A941
VLKEDLKKLPGVVSTGLSSSVPGISNNSAYSIIENNMGDDQVSNLDAYFVDYDFVSQFGLDIIAGRDFSRDFATDSTEAMIVNEQTVKFFGYSSPSEALGAKFSQWGKEGQIIGVVKDFHFKSLKENIKPMTLAFGTPKADLLAVKIRPDDVQGTLAAIQEKWEAILPNDTFNYYFLDEAFDRQYRAQERFGNLFLAFAFLAILISCLGLLGLAAYSTLQRKREIGIRKVIGSSVFGIVNLISKEFLKLIGIAFLIATPVAWFVMDAWLQDFAYRIDIEWWVFALAGASTLVIAMLTVSFHAIKAALANPVKSLRTE